MCNKAINEDPGWCLPFVPEKFKTQDMCDKAVDEDPFCLEYVHDRFKSQEMCSVKFSSNGEVGDVPDWFITPNIIKYGSFYEYIEWFNGYKERKAQKAQIKDELAPIAWHPDRVIDWCFDEDEKKDLQKIWG